MGKEAQTFRIEVGAHSNLKYFYFSLLLLLLLASVWSWPYYLVPTYRITLTFILLCSFCIQSYFLVRKQVNSILSISDMGRVVYSAEQKSAGWLLGSSRVYLGFFLLVYREELSNQKISLAVFCDQLNDTDQRRISRIIQCCKFSG